MTYFEVFNLANKILYIMLAVSVVLIFNKIIHHIYGFFPIRKLPETNKKHKFAIIIPARNESKVIRGILESIKNQTYDSDLIETFIVVESLDDPTVEIAKSYERTNVFVRQKLHLKGKGYAMDEVIQDIFEKGKTYDAFAVFDADNVLYSNCIEEMNKSYALGYKMAVGYRNSKNWNDSWVATCSALTFTMINVFQNKYKSRTGQNILISGSTFYIDYDIVKKLGGWKFYTLTEDYEMSLFATANNIRTYYMETVKSYDEQPTKFKVSWNQRLRWIKGYGQANKIYQKRILKEAFKDKGMVKSKLIMGLGVIPLIVLYATLIVYGLFTLIYGIVGVSMGIAGASLVLKAFLILIASVYAFFMFYAIIGIIAERKQSNLTFKSMVKAVIMNPIFMIVYLVLYIYAMFKKEVEWVQIEHKVNIDVNSNEKI